HPSTTDAYTRSYTTLFRSGPRTVHAGRQAPRQALAGAERCARRRTSAILREARDLLRAPPRVLAAATRRVARPSGVRHPRRRPESSRASTTRPAVQTKPQLFRSRG